MDCFKFWCGVLTLGYAVSIFFQSYVIFHNMNLTYRAHDLECNPPGERTLTLHVYGPYGDQTGTTGSSRDANRNSHVGYACHVSNTSALFGKPQKSKGEVSPKDDFRERPKVSGVPVRGTTNKKSKSTFVHDTHKYADMTPTHGDYISSKTSKKTPSGEFTSSDNKRLRRRAFSYSNNEQFHHGAITASNKIHHGSFISSSNTQANKLPHEAFFSSNLFTDAGILEHIIPKGRSNSDPKGVNADAERTLQTNKVDPDGMTEMMIRELCGHMDNLTYAYAFVDVYEKLRIICCKSVLAKDPLSKSHIQAKNTKSSTKKPTPVATTPLEGVIVQNKTQGSNTRDGKIDSLLLMFFEDKNTSNQSRNIAAPSNDKDSDAVETTADGTYNVITPSQSSISPPLNLKANKKHDVKNEEPSKRSTPLRHSSANVLANALSPPGSSVGQLNLFLDQHGDKTLLYTLPRAHVDCTYKVAEDTFFPLAIYSEVAAMVGTVLCACLVMAVSLRQHDFSCHLSILTVCTAVIGLLSSGAWIKATLGLFEDTWQYIVYLVCYFYVLVASIPVLICCLHRRANDVRQQNNQSRGRPDRAHSCSFLDPSFTEGNGDFFARCPDETGVMHLHGGRRVAKYSDQSVSAQPCLFTGIAALRGYQQGKKPAEEGHAHNHAHNQGHAPRPVQEHRRVAGTHEATPLLSETRPSINSYTGKSCFSSHMY